MNLPKRNILLSLSVVAVGISISQYFNVLPSFQFANSEEKTNKNIKQNVGFLNCSSLSERSKDFLKYHYVFRNFDPDLSKRTFDMFIKLLDPGKLYFTQDDINEFSKQEPDLFKNINNIDCRLIIGENGIYERYKKRLNEATNLAKSALNENPDFTKDEYIETDRKKIEWSKSIAELKDRWRKTIKFILLNMKDSDDVEKIKMRLTKRYEMIRKDIESRTTDEVYSLFLNAFALSLDPHSSFLTPTDNLQFQMDFSLKFVGIGATLKGVDGYTIIDAIVPGGAAAKDGFLKKNDKIVAVDSGDGTGIQDVIEMDLGKVVQLIRGKEGTTVKLVILRKELDGKMKRFNVLLKRAVVQIKDSEAKSEIMNINNKKIGVINLPSFYIDYKGCQDNPNTCRSSSNDMNREIKKLKAAKVDGILVDLRRNGGGDLSETQRIVSLFIKNPIVTQVEDREKHVRTLDFEGNTPVYTGPLAILVSKYTASASEILSGAVQDYGRGFILGDSRTFGKGTVQTVIEVPGTNGRTTDGAIHVTIAKFFRPSGKSNQEKGVLSDIIIPDIIDATDIGEKENDYALPYTTIKPSRDFKPERDLKEIIPKLQKMSALRIEKSFEFKKIINEIDKAKKDKNTLISLKESKDSIKNNLAKEKHDKKEENNDSAKMVTENKKDKNNFKKDTPDQINPTKESLKAKSENLGMLSGDDDNDDILEFSTKVIRKNDLLLKEAANILIDGIKLTYNDKKE
jgi:carboxyl-terminal processing protease